jgi:hypothetical protein
MTENPARAAILEIQVNAALAGHDLGPFEDVTDRVNGEYEARCRLCDLSAWVGESGLRYSLFGEKCQK